MTMATMFLSITMLMVCVLIGVLIFHMVDHIFDGRLKNKVQQWFDKKYGQ